MPSQQTLIPRSIKEFNVYITKTTAYLLAGTPANWTRFGWTSTDLSDWQAFLTDWQPLFDSYNDKKGRYTTSIKDQLYIIIATCVELNKKNRLLKSIEATRSLTATDLITFNLSLNNLNRNSPHHITKRTAPASEVVYPLLKPVGGGIIQCKCRTEVSKNGRPKKLEGFDMVEYAYKVVAQPTETTPANIPEDANEVLLINGHSTRANFLLPSGTNNTGKLFCIFFRWVNSKHPNLNGPWGACFTTTIL